MKTTSRFAPARILVVEDNITNQQVALGILGRLGLRADAVANGQEAVAALCSIPYDLVLMDCQMPVMDGYEATRRIREPMSPVCDRGVPIIAMTAHAMRGDRERCLEAGMDDYVAKPVSPRALTDVLARWLPEDSEPSNEDETGRSPQVPEREPPSEPRLWDREAMLERMGDNERLARKVTATFLEDTPRRLDLLAEMLAAGEVRGAERQAHSIKGSAATMGADALRALAFTVEMAARSGDLNTAAAHMDEMRVGFERLKTAMEEFFATDACHEA